MKHQGGRKRRADLPRTVAWEVLRDVATRDAYANLLLPGKLARTRLAGQDAAFATELTYGTLRNQGFYDAIISQAANRPAADIDAPVLAAMRMGAHQVLAMRVPNHAALSETVAVAKDKISQGAGGFVNAVLRRICEHDANEWLSMLQANADEPAALALQHSHPQWIVRALSQALAGHGRNRDEISRLLAADNEPARVCVSLLPGLAEPDSLGAAGEPTRYSPIGAQLVDASPHDIPAIAQGRARVQDEGSQLVALALAAAPSEATPTLPWLDLCAGPGGKTAVLAAQARLVDTTVDAVDVTEHRVELVTDSTRALDNVHAHLADGRHWGENHHEAYARVLVDVPCTGLGALRRRPEARWRRTPADVNALAPTQRELLSSAIAACAPGGIIAYTTCSPHFAETVLVVTDVLKRHPELDVLDAPQVLSDITAAPADDFASVAQGDGRFAQLWPHLHHTDGMFLALLRKKH